MAQREPKETVKELDPSEVAEVAEYVVADQELNEFLDDVKKQHPGVLETIGELAEKRNAALESASKAVKALEAPCGPFKVHQVRTTYNAEALFDAVGEAMFLTSGGSIQTKKVLEIDEKRFEAVAAFGKLPPQVIDAVRKRQVTFKQISKIWVP
jgi:cell division septum initiation protein DivIVA